MSAIASAAAMMTMVYEIPEAAVTAAASGRDYLSADILVQTKWEVDPVKAVVGLEHLPPNWDGYGSGPIERKTADRAIYLIAQIASLGFDQLPAPIVEPIQDGGVLFQWTAATRQLSLSVFADGTTEYLKYEAGEPFDEGSVDPRMAGRLRGLISWLLGTRV